MEQRYYLYLTRESWVGAWVNGGEIPINPASAYLSDVREGTRTPDEAYQQTSSGVPDWVLSDSDGPCPIKVMPGAGSIMLKNVSIDWGPGKVAHVAQGIASSRFEDGLILSLALSLDSQLAKKLGKEACVQIRCMACLIETLDQQIGTKCKWGKVRYRDGFARNHFLKSKADEWQQEYRLLWLTPDVSPRTVVLPPNMATRVVW